MPFRRVVAAFIREKGRILLARRREGDEQGGFWEFPGGGVEAGETLEEALKRELREELGVNVAVGRKIAVVQHRYGDLSIELHLFDARILNGT
ncbi:MAG TPA: (deoxy)nucleoside triphosphate pyrophosphohydrolase, partial [Candidatus Acetothermia bacterium]|nr:(deoxy)nucleoside triphosphate pyrophosphohydrolase [Candidatus Acetothermia bacterium]